MVKVRLIPGFWRGGEKKSIMLQFLGGTRAKGESNTTFCFV